MKALVLGILFGFIIQYSTGQSFLEITNSDTVYEQNFNALGTGTGSIANLEGWTVLQNGAPLSTLGANTGGGGAGAHNYGSSGNPDRALGARNTSGSQNIMQWALKNNTGDSIRSFGLYYTGEQWYGGLSFDPQDINLTLGLGPDLDNLTFYNITLDFSSPQQCNKITVIFDLICGSSKGSLNGNSSANREVLDTQIDLQSLTVPNGHFMVLRWQQENTSGTTGAHGMAIDDVGFVAHSNVGKKLWYNISDDLDNPNNWTRFPNEFASTSKPNADAPGGFNDNISDFFITKNTNYTGAFDLRGMNARLIVKSGVNLSMSNLSTDVLDFNIALQQNATFTAQIYDGSSGSATLNIDTCMAGSTVIFDSNTPNLGTLNIPAVSYANLEFRDSHGGNTKTYASTGTIEVRESFVYSAAANLMDADSALRVRFKGASIDFSMPNYSGEDAFNTFNIDDGTTLNLLSLLPNTADANALRLTADVRLGTGSMLSLDSAQSLILQSGSLVHDGILEVKNNASLIVNDGIDVSGTGMTSITRIPKTLGINVTNHWSSPVEGATIGLGGTITGNRHWVYRNGEDDDDNYVVITTLLPLGKGRGYTAKGVSAGATFVANTPDQLHIGSFTYNALAEPDGDADEQRFYLVGNPFSSGISVSDFLEKNSETDGEIFGAVYLFSQVNTFGTYSRVADNIAINLLGSTDPGEIIPDSVQDVSLVSDFNIASGQGFFVIDRTPNDDQISLDFNASMQRGLNNDFKRVESKVKARFWLLIHDGSLYKTTLIGIADDAKLGEDVRYDAPKAVTEKTLNIWSYIDGKEYEIQGLPPATVASYRVPVGVNINKPGVHEISAVKASGLEGESITLLDAETGMFTDLRKGAYKFFTSRTGKIPNRFFLIIRGSGQPVSVDELENLPANGACQAFISDGNNIRLNPKIDASNLQHIELFTVDGKKLNSDFSERLLDKQILPSFNQTVLINYQLKKTKTGCYQRLF